MRIYELESSPYTPVTHDPTLKKRVLTDAPFSCVRRISHIVLQPGDEASLHAHEREYEVFYCVRGELEFAVGGLRARLKAGSCLVVEPGEPHSITLVLSESELLYLHAGS